MTPAEDYARKRLEKAALIRQYAPDALHDDLIAHLQPAIALNSAHAEDSDISIGASKFGGAPDVAEGFEWPVWNGKSLTFLAQLSLEEVAPFDLEKQLPSAGVLLFFVMLDEQSSLWDDPDQREGWRVIWACEPLQRAQVPADSHWVVAQFTQSVKFEAAWALPEDWLDYDWDESQQSEFGWEVLEKPPHRMLTCLYAPQESPLLDTAYISRHTSSVSDEADETAEWTLLLQLDTGVNGFFEGIHDVDWLYFLIRRDDLRNGDFSRVWLDQQGT